MVKGVNLAGRHSRDRPLSERNIQQKLLDAVDRLAAVRVGVLGDLVADLYVSGRTDRVSREAPVLIIQYENEWVRPGGAANVAANLAALGARVGVVGWVGDDDAGKALLHLLESSQPAGSLTCTKVLSRGDRQTITKTRFLAGARLTSRQQVLRLDREPADRPSRELLDALRERVNGVDADVDAWAVSDYGYGAFDDAMLDALRAIAARKPVVVDSRYELHRFKGMTLLKPNEEEAQKAAFELKLHTRDDVDLASSLADRLEAKSVVITLGNKGMIASDGRRARHVAAVGADQIVDLTGAGDTVAATLAASIAAGVELEAACRLANHAASIVVMKEGAATCSPDELRGSIRRTEGRAS